MARVSRPKSMQIETDTSSAPADNDPPAESGGRGSSVIDKRVFWLQVASLVIVTGVSLAAIPYAEQIRQNAGPAYLVLFLLSVQSGALFMLPGFGWASIAVFAVAFDNVWGPVLVGTTGQVAGEMVSYLLGVTGSPWIQRRRSYQRVEAWIKRWGLLVILAIAALPNPFFDLAGTIAGAARLGWWKFFVASWAGRLIKNIGFAAMGVQGADFIRQFF